MRSYEYLSEEELEQLILCAEEDPANAPGGLLESILAAIDGESCAENAEGKKLPKAELEEKLQKPPNPAFIKSKRTAFRGYCFRVITSVAAAVVLAVAVPGLLNSGTFSIPESGTLFADGFLMDESAGSMPEKGVMRAVGQSHRIADFLGYNIFE